MKNYWCEQCDYRWKQEDRAKECPKCHEICDIRTTMSEEEARDKGLIGDVGGWECSHCSYRIKGNGSSEDPKLKEMIMKHEDYHNSR